MEVTIHYNGQAVAVEVTLEVHEFDEYIVATGGVGIYGETPEDYLCRMETLGELMTVLDTCTEAQRRRFLLYALDGLSFSEIAALGGCSKSSSDEVWEAIRQAQREMNNYERRRTPPRW